MSENRPAIHLAHRVFAEFIGTGFLVFAGTSAIVVNDISAGSITHPGIALVFGLIVTTLIYTFGNISGAHFNPAVTLALWLARHITGKQVMPYLLSQFAGALLASVLVRLLFAPHPTLGATLPAGNPWQSFTLEILLTYLLMLTIIQLSTAKRDMALIAGAVIGAVVMLEALFAGPISGASMNPARSLGPAIVSQHLQSLWIYLIAPVIGSVLAIATCRCLRESTCCR